MGALRLDKYLADAGLGSRGQVKQLIRKGLVTVDGVCVRDPAYVLAESSPVSCQGQAVLDKAFVYILFFKPAGCVCAARDRYHKTIFDYIPQTRKRDLAPVGRLDLDTEGLLLVTNDGALTHRLLAPGRHVDKTYYAETTGRLGQAEVRAFAEGMDIGERRRLDPAELLVLLNREDPAGSHREPVPSYDWEREPWGRQDHGTGQACAYVTIHEGKFHQIKRMFAMTGHELTYLKRLRMGPLVLDPALSPGDYRPLTEEEEALVRSY